MQSVVGDRQAPNATQQLHNSQSPDIKVSSIICVINQKSGFESPKNMSFVERDRRQAVFDTLTSPSLLCAAALKNDASVCETRINLMKSFSSNV